VLAPDATQCVNFSYDLSLGYTTHGGVARHLRNGVHVHGNKHYLGAHVGCCGCSFASGVTGTYYYYIVLLKHDSIL
jgi:hypothetical protein